MNRGWVLLLVSGCAALLLYLNIEPQTPVANDAQVVERNSPDLAGQDVLFHQLHENGSLHYRLKAVTINQFTDENLTRMEIPELHLRSATQAPWDIDSREGFIRQSETPEQTMEDIVYLRDQVRMEQENPNSGTITLRSDSFYLYPDRQFAETQQDVIIDTEVGRTTAAGLTADLDTGVIRLSSSDNQRVHTIVLPEQFKQKS